MGMFRQLTGNGRVSHPCSSYNPREMFEQFLTCSRSASPATPKILLVAAALLLMPMALSGQLVTGSIAVLQSADDYLVIAADSKSLSRKGISLHRCKIVVLDDQLVYECVYGRGNARVWRPGRVCADKSRSG